MRKMTLCNTDADRALPAAAAGGGYRYLDGSTPAAERGKRIGAFQRGEGDLFLISLKAGGFGLDLTAADDVIIVDPWSKPAAEDQALGRAHRIGQQRPVTVYRLVTAGSVNERIVALHGDKRHLADGILADQGSSAPLRADKPACAVAGRVRPAQAAWTDGSIRCRSPRRQACEPPPWPNAGGHWV